MATVILARHGRTSANATGVLAGRGRGVHLDETGRAQATAAAERLQNLPLAAVVSSPMARCLQTARLLAPEREPVQDRGLIECDYGDWTGRELKTLVKEDLWRVVQAQPSAARFPGGESMTQMSARGLAAVRTQDAEVERAHGEHAVWLAVSHGDVIKAVLADALGMHLDAFQRIVVDPASLSVIRYTPTRTFVLTMNSRAGALDHLHAPPPPRSRRRGRATARDTDAVLGGGAGPDTPTP